MKNNYLKKLKMLFVALRRWLEHYRTRRKFDKKCYDWISAENENKSLFRLWWVRWNWSCHLNCQNVLFVQTHSFVYVWHVRLCAFSILTVEMHWMCVRIVEKEFPNWVRVIRQMYPGKQERASEILWIIDKKFSVTIRNFERIIGGVFNHKKNCAVCWVQKKHFSRQSWRLKKVIKSK